MKLSLLFHYLLLYAYDMTTVEGEDKRYVSYHIEWNDKYEEYDYANPVTHEGKVLQFDTYKEFLDFMASLTEDEKFGLGLWRLEDYQLGDYITIVDGLFDDVSFLSLNAAKPETKK